MKNIIISIRPVFCKEIYCGQKALELRRSVGKGFKTGVKLYIYSSSPTKAVSGEAVIDTVEKLPVIDIRNRYLNDACISERDFDEYYSGKEYGYVIFLRCVRQYNRPISLQCLSKVGFRAPQSYMYARAEVESIIENSQCT